MSMIDRLEGMLAAGRDDAMLRFGLGSACFNENRLDDAVTHLSACIAMDESYSAAYKLLGKALFRLERFDEAAGVFNRGLDVAAGKGDKQSEKEIRVFLKKLEKHASE